jgi:hypothetical protein
VDLPWPALRDSNELFTLSCIWLPDPEARGHVVAMKDAEFQWLALERSAIGGLCGEPACPPGCGPPTAGGSCGPIRPASACSAQPVPQPLAEKTFGPADRHRRQVARLAGRLLAGGAIRLERLQGFGAAPAGLSTCGCSRFDFPRWQPRRSDRRRQHRA